MSDEPDKPAPAQSNSTAGPSGEAVSYIAPLFGISASTAYRWIREGKLKAELVDGVLRLDPKAFGGPVLDRIQQLIRRPERTYVPREISRYSEWHEVLDEIVWLLKVFYSSSADLKARRFRTDILFANYLRDNGVSAGNFRQSFLGSAVSRGVWEDLQRGWYNELAFNFPLRKSTLGLSFRDIDANEHETQQRYAFPSWRITMAYYSFYFYLRAVTRLKQPSFRIHEHMATLTNFKSCALRPFEDSGWAFPLSVSYSPNRRQPRKGMPARLLRHLRFAYASHPRTPNRSPEETLDHVRMVFNRRSRLRPKPALYTLFDYLHDFRIWANYQEIAHLLNLYGPGYKGFLDQNLSTIVFFAGGLAELALLSLAGQPKFLQESQRFYELVSAAGSDIEFAYPHLPLSQRLDILRATGFLDRSIRYRARPPDHNRARITWDVEPSPAGD